MKTSPNSLVCLFLATEKEFPFERLERLLAIASDRAGVTVEEIKAALWEAHRNPEPPRPSWFKRMKLALKRALAGVAA